MTRLPYVQVEQAPPEVREIFQKMSARGAKIANIFRVSTY